ncbi:N-acetyl-1-D-myo-inositol-2-amino-2-deoxy-alpha-D-glucopyranoside deacetylase [Corynebacterium breve]|uniref:1D-myo-inositol 2-acetamido-2-deoxy-alpha-D-glucopyranoside deacetylase n=1 Tax=Corynebacterium breve TaxID=3049799 RepID=A0ABY8VHW7_9CORY|nr:N-acetyl-1-D-myo-inositol-2-amino-2-deoxy-alpha-D-glucopyranoside deacetylase [Corynebacterium breve]WIM68556.1 N-acetyl-1-D-myo-inositol-2-amino-2-deoxy-alpha-D-glucopyranoside deacetylase [Corynebacterium breve]
MIPVAHNQRDLAGYRVIAVHAHPDDEAIWTGGTLADLARRGADVLVVTCTLGEEGEVIGETYQGLVNDAADQLGGFRIAELASSLRILGARGTFLGGAGAFRDSGMAGSPAHDNPRAFVNSGQQATEALAEIFRAERPHLVLTYGPDGGYGHPDHIQAHDITHAAAQQVEVPRIAWAVQLRADLDRDAATTIPTGWRAPEAGELAAVDSADTWVELDDIAYATKIEAMRAHATQLWIADGSVSETNPHAAWGAGPRTVFALSNLIAQPVLRREHYQMGAGLELPQGAELLYGIEK